MAEEKNADVIEDVVDVPEVVETKDEQGNDTTDWKALAEANRELALKNQGIAKRFKTKFEKSKEVTPPATPVEKKIEPKSDNIDYGELAFLTAKGIEDDEVDFVKEEAKKAGKTLKEILGNKYFQGELKDRRELKKSQEALPKDGKRSTQSSRDTVEYWMDKPYGEIPDGIRIKVLNAKIKKEKSAGSNFSANPIIGA